MKATSPACLPWVRTPGGFWQHSEFSRFACGTWCSLASDVRADENAEVYPSNSRLGQFIGSTSERSIFRALAEFEESGLITRIGGGARGSTTCYRLIENLAQAACVGKSLVSSFLPPNLARRGLPVYAPDEARPQMANVAKRRNGGTGSDRSRPRPAIAPFHARSANDGRLTAGSPSPAKQKT